MIRCAAHRWDARSALALFRLITISDHAFPVFLGGQALPIKQDSGCFPSSALSIKASFPFCLLLVLAAILITAFPQIVLLLPQAMRGA